MAKKKKKKPDPKPKPPGYVFGNPTLYRAEYCELLVKHMAQGSGFHTFGATLNPPVSHQTVYDWADAHPNFLEAKSRGEQLSEIFWEGILKGGASGQLKRVKSQKVKIDSNGQVVMGPDGKPVIEKEYEPATFNATATIFALKNKFPSRWRDRKEIDVGGKSGAPVRISSMSKEEAKLALEKMMAIFSEAVEEDEEKGE